MLEQGIEVRKYFHVIAGNVPSYYTEYYQDFMLLSQCGFHSGENEGGRVQCI